MTEEVTLVFDVPGPKAPGFLLRQKEALQFKEQMEGDMSPGKVDELVVYLSQFVTEPEDQEGKEKALWIATEEETMSLINALTGKTPEGEPDPTE